MASPEIGCRSGPPGRLLVNSGPGVVPRATSQAPRAATGSGGGMPAVGDADDLAAAVEVGLGAADGDQQAGGLALDVGEGERGELTAAQRGGEPEQDQRGVPGTLGAGAVDAGDDGTDLVHAKRPGLPDGGGAEAAAQTAADLSDGLVAGRVDGSGAAVLERDRAAGQADGAERDALLGALGQVGAHRGRGGGQRVQVAAGAPGRPVAPRPGVGVQRVRCVVRGDRIDDAGGVGGGEPGELGGQRGTGCGGSGSGGHAPVVAGHGRGPPRRAPGRGPGHQRQPRWRPTPPPVPSAHKCE